ncbi:hypothetical protein BE04_35965 [Sorangium cellulosum]|uniref:Uncharacterized protein n=2 Tax=Sorangium cellulosum TaxID=56 RepID=A0A150P4W1_SORCE|nr:hypothetical protein [Sorangium cellulosum]AGP40392.1 hypothetical protein SCE1572_41355 [Sorangium cellulosum So0157-2]KYF50733.1 hypothetical protein BE04_35965 [Sorangium cellulosum]
MSVEWSKDILLIWEIVRKLRSSGMSPAERRALAEQFGVSEEVVLRYERARAAYNEQIADNEPIRAGSGAADLACLRHRRCVMRRCVLLLHLGAMLLPARESGLGGRGTVHTTYIPGIAWSGISVGVAVEGVYRF